MALGPQRSSCLEGTVARLRRRTLVQPGRSGALEVMDIAEVAGSSRSITRDLGRSHEIAAGSAYPSKGVMSLRLHQTDAKNRRTASARILLCSLHYDLDASSCMLHHDVSYACRWHAWQRPEISSQCSSTRKLSRRARPPSNASISQPSNVATEPHVRQTS